MYIIVDFVWIFGLENADCLDKTLIGIGMSLYLAIGKSYFIDLTAFWSVFTPIFPHRLNASKRPIIYRLSAHYAGSFFMPQSGLDIQMDIQMDIQKWYKNGR